MWTLSRYKEVRMKSILSIILIGTTFLLAFYIPTRPPEPPVNFIYDPNMVNFDIIESIRAYPSTDIQFVRKIIEPDGQTPTLTFSDESIAHTLAMTTVDPNDPDGISKIFIYDCTFPVNRPPGIYYVDIKAEDNDPNEPFEDNRTMIFYIWPKNRPPVIK
jgi:hypothetical protein